METIGRSTSRMAGPLARRASRSMQAFASTPNICLLTAPARQAAAQRAGGATPRRARVALRSDGQRDAGTSSGSPACARRARAGPLDRRGKRAADSVARLTSRSRRASEPAIGPGLALTEGSSQVFPRRPGRRGGGAAMKSCGRCGRDRVASISVDDSMEVCGHIFTAQLPATRCESSRRADRSALPSAPARRV